MRILVTGGTGVVGRPTVDALLARGHEVRLFSRNAERDAAEWEGEVDPRAGSVTDVEALREAARGCDAILHIAGIVREDPPEVTFEAINVEGTRSVVRAAEEAGVARLVYVSSLGAERGESDYHRSKFAGEEAARTFRGSWLICRPGNVYGPGDEVISLLLKMHRSLPVVPVIGDGEQPVQPAWADDVGEALAIATERVELEGRVLLLAGDELTDSNAILDHFDRLEKREVRRIPVPEWMASAGLGAADAVGIELPFTPDQVTMLREGSYLRDEETNDLVETLGLRPIPLADGLRELIDALPERMPREGVGPLRRNSYTLDVRGATRDAEEVFDILCRDFDSLPVEELLEVDPARQRRMVLEEGATLTLHIPLRGTIQVRVEEVDECTATAVTLEGHPLSGVIRWRVREISDEQSGEPRLRLEIRSYTRGSSVVDELAMQTVGRPLQSATWSSVLEALAERTGGEAVGEVKTRSEALDADEAETVEGWVEALVARRKAMDRERGTGDGG